MKWTWGDWFGSGSVELPDAPTWQVITPAPRLHHSGDSSIKLQFILDEKPRIRMTITPSDADFVFTELSMNFVAVESVDHLIGELIRMRDLMAQHTKDSKN